MKNLKKILLTSVIAATALGGGATALGNEFGNWGGYKFIYPLWKREDLALFPTGFGVNVQNHLNDIQNAVSYWHAWFWSNNQSNRSETTFLDGNYDQTHKTDYIYYNQYWNNGYATVLEIQTLNNFYYLEFDAMNFTVSLTHSKIGEYPKFYDVPIWTISDPINGAYVDDVKPILDIKTNPEKTSLIINWDNLGSGIANKSWVLPY